ncbi:uncharacterized protein LOC142764908 [Rhipicephalus microplus]|uniref:uncharacterized protein LOC142764908 n=1 Tax=Rhipicephalus microplus TaxID=6941 RepID=UPI003F6D3DBB
MCSVSETATHQTMYPGDGICDILMYTDVRLLNETFEELIVPASYQLFLELSAKTYKRTTCGISLDVRYINKTTDKGMTSALQFVQTKKIKHFGILKIYGTDADLQSYGPALLKKTTAKLRSVIPASEYGKSSHIIFGFGYYSYDFKDSYNTLKATVTKLTS